MDLHPDIERLALLGWRLHPASGRTRAACFSNASTLATSDLDQLGRWSREFSRCGWRVVMEGSGIWALDVDVPGARHKHDGVAALQELIATHGPLPRRPTTRSGGGGLALFFRHEGEAIVGKGGHPALGMILAADASPLPCLLRFILTLAAPIAGWWRRGSWHLRQRPRGCCG
jgi:Bifunctional DNA primase/polymerase, N-terminal